MANEELIALATKVAEKLEKETLHNKCKAVNKGKVNRILTALYVAWTRGADAVVVESLMERIAKASNTLEEYETTL